MPVPDVRRRYLTKDPVARTGAMILERALSYSMEQYDFRDVLDRCLEDYLLPGRAESIVCYKPMFETQACRAVAAGRGSMTRRRVRLTWKLLRGVRSLTKGPQYPEGTQFDAQGAFTRCSPRRTSSTRKSSATT
jgi:hypothetical protein